MIGLTWPRYNWTVFDVSGLFGIILNSFFCLLSVFPVVFLGCLCAFLGHFCVCRALFLKINFVQHWQSLSAVQNYSSKIQALDFSTLFLSPTVWHAVVDKN